MLDNLLKQVSSIGDSFFQALGGKKASLRYPLSDEGHYQNMVKFTALARIPKNGQLDKFKSAPEYTSQGLGSATLYMPQGLTVNDNLSYDNVDTAMSGMLVNSFQNSATTGEFLKQVAKDSPQLADRFISYQLAKASQEKGLVGGAAGQILINRGEVVNPHTQMLFRAPALRQFSFNFKMMPRSKAEAEAILKIVKFFRLCAYPSLGNSQLANDKDGSKAKSLNMQTFTFPEVFEIKYLNKGSENGKLIKLGRAYLTSITVNYNPTSPSFFADGMPSEIDLSLTFQETKALSREDIRDGY